MKVRRALPAPEPQTATVSYCFQVTGCPDQFKYRLAQLNDKKGGRALICDHLRNLPGKTGRSIAMAHTSSARQLQISQVSRLLKFPA